MIWGAVLALTVFPVMFIGTSITHPISRDWPNAVWAAAFAIPLCCLFALPELTIMLSLPPVLAQLVLVDALTYGNAVPLLGLVAVAARREWRAARWWAAANLLGCMALIFDTWTGGFEVSRSFAAHLSRVVPVFFVAAVPVCSAVFLGRAMHLQREQTRLQQQRAIQLERDRELSAALAAQQERARIAADLHDVLAHSLSVIVIQTDAAALILNQSSSVPTAARGAVTTAHDTAIQALSEIRALVQTINTTANERAPQPTLVTLPELIAVCDPTGTRLSLVSDVELAAPPLTPSAEIAAYRIIQEALTNVLRHAGPDARAVVRIANAHDHITIDVEDDGTATTCNSDQGNGLSNMAERARSVGGVLDAGPRPSGGFQVHVELPSTKREVEV